MISLKGGGTGNLGCAMCFKTPQNTECEKCWRFFQE
jgi:hypothetical protein